MAKEIFVAYGVDVDAVAGWLGSYGGENSPDDISRGLFAGEVGTPRLLELFRRNELKTTWFIPGHSIETFPRETEQVVAAGHEVGIHGYTHENPIAMSREQETAVLDKCIDLVERVSGRRPTGYVAPWWEFSNVTNELLLERGIKYDHSLMHKDFEPYYVRVGDSWTKIDYSKQAEEWMVPLAARRGDRPDRDPGQLVPRRPAADDVHQDGAEQPRLRQPARHRAALARPVRLGLPRVRLRRLHDDDPSRRERPARSARHARADHRAHQQARRRSAGRPSTRSPTTSRSASRATHRPCRWTAVSPPRPRGPRRARRLRRARPAAGRAPSAPARSPAKSAPASARSRPPPRPYTGCTRPSAQREQTATWTPAATASRDTRHDLVVGVPAARALEHDRRLRPTRARRAGSAHRSPRGGGSDRPVRDARASAAPVAAAGCAGSTTTSPSTWPIGP